VTPLIHAALEGHDLLPGTHIVDTGFLDAQLLVASRQVYDVDLLGPTRLDYHWQARERNGFAAEHVRIDWERREATRPEGHTSASWTPSTDRSGDRVIRVKFSPKVCRHCPSRTACTRATKPPRRTITIQDDAAFHALHAARARTRAPDYDAEYRRRAGIEGTLSRGVRRCGLVSRATSASPRRACSTP
jgi:transposase